MITVTLALLCILLFGGAWTDFKYRQVKNGWLLWGIVAGVWLQGMAFFTAAAAALILVFLLFRLGLMGAGDGKMIVCIAGYLGLHNGFMAVGFGMAVGTVWSLGIFLHHRSLMTRLKYLYAWFRQRFLTKTWIAYIPPAGEHGEGTIPLAACLAVGTYLYLLPVYWR